MRNGEKKFRAVSLMATNLLPPPSLIDKSPLKENVFEVPNPILENVTGGHFYFGKDWQSTLVYGFWLLHRVIDYPDRGTILVYTAGSKKFRSAVVAKNSDFEFGHTPSEVRHKLLCVDLKRIVVRNPPRLCERPFQAWKKELS